MSNSKGDFMNTSKTKNREKNLARKKPQENDSQSLFESQESILNKISDCFSQSFHSTNVGDREEALLQAMGIKEGKNQSEAEESCSHYSHKTLDLIKQQSKTIAENFNLNISQSSQLEKFSNSNNEKWEMNRPFVFGEEDVEMEDCSQESVSMLEGLNQNNFKNEFPQLIETCMNSEFEVISISTDDEGEQLDEEIAVEEKTVFKVENSTQTNFSIPMPELIYPRDIEITKHANFIKSVVKLKALLSSKEPVSDKEIFNILHNTIKHGKMTEEDYSSVQENNQIVSKETIGYLIRSSDIDNVFFETVKTLLQHLESAFGEDFLKTASFWKNSVYEMTVTMLSDAVECEAGVWKMVDMFLCETIDSILKDAGKSKNFVLESKTNVIISFCQSTHLSYTAINFIIRKLKKLKIIKPKTESLTRDSWEYLTKNSYFLLRILESSLHILKSKIAKGKTEEIFAKKPVQKNYNVLEMWKKHWKTNEICNEKKVENDWDVIMNKWCKDLDEILIHCVNYIPVLSMIVERCGVLAKEILKLIHPTMMMDQIENTLSVNKKIKNSLNLDSKS